ncbi:hypothetical protein TrVE_jg5473 [Triparma verrucosa]|uniref:Ubiquitin-like domain-containing protein n=2 Tax=Triparma TaxID=722752 RepID=A0A9W6ZW79_9STRA|nr:hypothetical protein TrST_g11509 [Triparma strigata]GMH83920.1 hypothetical protein TrVE_jg5473 [Triparma verrucosa]
MTLLNLTVKYQDDLSKDSLDIRLDDVKPTDSVADLKAAIFIRQGVPASQQNLVFEGKELSDYIIQDGKDSGPEKTLQQLGVLDNSVISMTMCEEKKEGKRQLSREYYDDRDTDEGASRCIIS